MRLSPTGTPGTLFFCDKISHPRSQGLLLTLTLEIPAWKNPRKYASVHAIRAYCVQGEDISVRYF